MIVSGMPTNPGVPFDRLDGLRVANDTPYFGDMAFPFAAVSGVLPAPAPVEDPREDSFPER
jgi:hypothetical protein